MTDSGYFPSWILSLERAWLNHCGLLPVFDDQMLVFVTDLTNGPADAASTTSYAA